MVTHVSENLGKVNDFYYLVLYIAFNNINMCSVRSQIHKSPVMLLFYFISKSYSFILIFWLAVLPL